MSGEREMALALDQRLARERPDRPLLIGQAPGPRTEGWPALLGDSGDRIVRLAGITPPNGGRPAAALLELAERVNVLERWPGAVGDGDKFPVAESRKAAEDLMALLVARGAFRSNRKVLLLGRAADAFGWKLPFFEWTLFRARGCDRCCWGAKFPHPSGRNRFWNEEENRCRGRLFLRELFGLGPVARPEQLVFAQEYEGGWE